MERNFLFILNTHTHARIVPPCILFMWMETTQLLVDGAVRQTEREREKKRQLAKHVCVVQYSWGAVGAVAFMCFFHCFSRGRAASTDTGSEEKIKQTRQKKYVENRRLVGGEGGMKRGWDSSNAPVCSCVCHLHIQSPLVLGRARVSEPRNIMTVVTSEPIVSQFSALVVLKLTWPSNRLTQVHPPVSQRAALMKR